MKVKNSEQTYMPFDNEIVKVKNMNGIVEVMYIEHIPTGLTKIQKVDKDHYIDLCTGELKEYIHTLNRSQNPASMKHTFMHIRDIINNNFTGGKNELMVTLTYAENMTDTKRLYSDFDVFMHRFKRKYPNCSYFMVVEPQARGAWHCHLLVKDNTGNTLYIPDKVIAKMWGHGFTKTKRIKNVDNIGAYLSAYLADIELDEYMKVADVPDHIEIIQREVDDENGPKQSKAFVKGGRCYLYPVGMNIYRHSRDIKPPAAERMSWKDAKKIVGECTPDYTSAFEIASDDGIHLNTVQYLHYNQKRRKKQV